MRSKPLAIALILLTFFGTSTSWHADDEDAGQSPLVAHDHSAHQEKIHSQSDNVAPTHCALCHWLQSFRAGAVRQARIPFASTARAAEEAVLSVPTPGIDLVQSSPRAPPRNA